MNASLVVIFACVVALVALSGCVETVDYLVEPVNSDTKFANCIPDLKLAKKDTTVCITNLAKYDIPDREDLSIKYQVYTPYSKTYDTMENVATYVVSPHLYGAYQEQDVLAKRRHSTSSGWAGTADFTHKVCDEGLGYFELIIQFPETETDIDGEIASSEALFSDYRAQDTVFVFDLNCDAIYDYI